MIDGVTYGEPIGKSDHLVMEWNLACYVAPVATRVVKYQFDKANFNYMRIAMAAVNWNDVLVGESIDDQLGHLYLVKLGPLLTFWSLIHLQDPVLTSADSIGNHCG